MVAPTALQRQQAAPVPSPPRTATRLAPPPLPVARPTRVPALSVQASPSRLPAAPRRPGSRVIQGKVQVNGNKLDADQIILWLKRCAIDFPSGEVARRIVAYLVGKPDVLEFGEYDVLDFMKRLQRAAKAFYQQEAPKMKLVKKLQDQVGSLMPLATSNLLGGYYIYLAGEDYLRALAHYEKLADWVRQHQEWIDVATKLNQLREPAEKFIREHGASQQGRRVTDLWQNIVRGGFSLNSDLSRYGDWMERIGQAMRAFVNPNTDTGYRDPHLDTFHAETRDITAESSASTIRALAKISGAVVAGAPARVEILTAMQRPDTSSEVVNTTADGEVVPLANTLEAFLQFLAIARNQTTPKRFELAISGSWGACDGCKKRINEFVTRWAAAARSNMNRGVSATLRVTYRYLNRPKGFKREWGTTTYGWHEDNRIGGAYFHTVDHGVAGA